MIEITLSDFVGYIALAFGLLLLGRWLLQTSLGRKALLDAPPRPTQMPFWAPLAVLFIWATAGMILGQICEAIAQAWDVEESGRLAIRYVFQSLLYIVIIFFMGWLGWKYFEQKLKGLGVGFRYFAKDLWYGAGTFLAIMPAVLAAAWAVLLVGRLFMGHEYTLPENTGLTEFKELGDIRIKVLVFVCLGLIGPVFEETLFRGLFQSIFRGVTHGIFDAWAAVIMTSLLFVSVHPMAAHWPALFVLSMAIGYSYEKSGSLIRAIIVHSLFNVSTMSVALVGT